VLFTGGALFAFRDTGESEAQAGLQATQRVSSRRTAATAFLVIFLAEWGDLTQILTANLAARYHAPVSVAIGSVAALWAVAGIAVVGSRHLARLPMSLVRRITAVVLLGLAIVSLVEAVR
jgi:putative Ca2+/H+ antiporter (TMEM165/GDT1 family)